MTAQDVRIIAIDELLLSSSLRRAVVYSGTALTGGDICENLSSVEDRTLVFYGSSDSTPDAQPTAPRHPYEIEDARGILAIYK